MSAFNSCYFKKTRAEIRKKSGSPQSGLLHFIRFVMITFLTFPFPGNALDSSALPTGGDVTSGQGSISSSGNTMTVNQQSDRMVANWETFNIGQDASVNFQQPGASSVALNRINDQNVSEILGSLSANGQIFLLNPNGVIFGSSAQVNVGGLVASSLNLTDENFMKGKYAFEGSGGSVSNLGTIRTTSGGYVAFLSPQVKNEGSIGAPGGAVLLAAGTKVNLEIEGTELKKYDLNPETVEENKEDTAPDTEVTDSSTADNSSGATESQEKEVTTEMETPVAESSKALETEKVNVDFSGDQLVSLTVDKNTLETIAENKGLISAEGGMVVMTAKAVDEITQSVVNNTGIIEAKGISEQGGKILLDAAGGQTTVSGTLDASSDHGSGGSVIATGDYVLIEEGAHLNASGASGGGEVLVGGSWQGKDDGIHEATGTVVNQGAVLEANATDTGKGGTVVVWSDTAKTDSVTRAYGTFEAKGGVNRGDGGRIETSGHWLDTAGAKGSASALNGKSGEWLFDPYNVTITGASANGSFGGGLWTPSANNSTILNTAINTLLEGGTSVTITTNGAGAQIGDITVDSAITKAIGNTDVTLTLNAANSILVNQAISNTGGTGKLNVVLDADNNSGTGDGAGIVMLYADIATNGGSLSFGTGRTAMIGGVSTLVGGDVFVAGAGARTVSTTGGNVNVRGEMIVANTNGLSINSGNGSVHFYGLLNSGNQYTFVDKTGSAGSGTWSLARTEAINGTGGVSAINDSYLVNITSRLENSVAVASAGYKGAWIGAWRPNEATGAWVWADGPEASQQFFTQTTNGSSGVTSTGYYSNFGSGEPNGSMTVTPAERVGQFFGTGAEWNDLNLANTYSATQANQYNVLGFVKETNLANSPVTISSGTGTVTFDRAVGTSKALKSLSVTSATTAINGGAVTTDSASAAGGQSYSGDITLGSASTLLTMRDTPTAFTLNSGKTITNQSGVEASLHIKTTADIILGTNSSISSAGHSLDVILNSDSDSNGGGITLNAGTTVNSNGGNIVMGGGTCTSTGSSAAAIGTGAVGTAGITLNGTSGSPVSISSGGGDLWMWGRGPTLGGNGIKADYATVDSGAAGALTMRGDGWYTTTINGNGNGLLITDTTLRGGSGGMMLTGNASTNNPGVAQWSWGAEFSGASSAYTTNGGALDIHVSVNQNNGNNYYLTTDPTSTLGHATLQNGNIFITYSGTATTAITAPNILIPSGDLTITSHRGLSAGNTQTVAGTTTVNGGGTSFDVSLGTSGTFNSGTLTVSNARNVSILDEDTLTLGALNSNIAGTIDVATKTGNLTLTQNITTTDASNTAVILNAGKNTAAGTSTGGNIIVSGVPSVSVGAGGRATLYSGSVSGSTGLTDLMGSGSGHFRYNSDETASNYTLALGTSNYAIYREQPAVIITASDDSRVYSGLGYTGGNGVTSSGFVNGDTFALLSGTLTYGGTSQGAVNGGIYSIVPSGYADTLGYSLAYADGTLTITAPVSEPVPPVTPPVVPTEPSPPSTPALPESPVYEPIQDSVNSGLTSTQTGVNGTQREENSGAENSFTPAMGAGAGSASVDQFNATPLINEPLSSQGDMILSSSFQTTPVQFEQTGEGTVLFTGKTDTTDSSSSEALTLPLFVQKGKFAPAAEGVLMINAKEKSLSLKTSALKEIPELKEGKMDQAPSTPFTLSLPDGTAIEINVSVSGNGVLVISVEETTGQVNMNQIVLMSLQMARTELKTDLSRIKSVKVIKNK